MVNTLADNIRFILVNPSHPGNIGAAARAMKTMGFSCLYLVDPKEFPNVNATAMAAGADDILANAVVTSSLTEALVGVKLVFGTSARQRALPLLMKDPKQAGQVIADAAKSSQIAILFGRENNGLSNEELALCNYHLHIPTNPQFNSLNIAQAVQLIAYEISCTTKTEFASFNTGVELASSEEVQALYQHLEQVLTSIDFFHKSNLKNLMLKLKRLFNRSQLEKIEVSILRGVLTAINSKVQKK